MRISSLFLLAALPLAACGSGEEPATPPSDADVAGSAETPAPSTDGAEYAVARIEPVGESSVNGTVEFRALDGAVEVRYDLNGLGAGDHGFHVHENGSCGPGEDGTPGGAAGGHFNPMSSPHGGPSAIPAERHAGDLGNVTVSPDGTAQGVVVDSLLAFSGPTSFVGKAMMVHAGQDDLTSQPSGDAGDRVGCGVVALATPSDPATYTPDTNAGTGAEAGSE